MGKVVAIIIAFCLLGMLLNMCDSRSESEKWEDSMKSGVEAYAEYRGGYY